jgi:glycosyltransferase involved in cell wall biosynthesis
MKVSVIIPCKGRLDHLQQTIPNVLKQSFQDMEVIVVDYACPQNTWRWVAGLVSPKVRCEIAKVEPNEWSLSAARNFGFKHAKGEVILFLDADTIIDQEFIIQSYLLLQPGHFVTGLVAPPWNGCGCMMVYREDFERARGYNEALKSWGYEDMDMYGRLETAGLTRLSFNPKLIVNIQHENCIRNEFHGNQNIHETCRQNFELSKTTFESSI